MFMKLLVANYVCEINNFAHSGSFNLACFLCAFHGLLT
jgi:hypothetical protein